MPVSRWFFGSVLAMALAVPPAVASAFPVLIRFEGVIETVQRFTSVDPFGDDIAIGTPFRGQYLFDTSMANSGTDDYGVYIFAGPQYGIDIHVGDYFGSSSTASLPLHYRIIDGALSDRQDIQTQGMSFGGVNAYLVQLFFEGPPTTLSSVDLSASPPSLSDYFVHQFFLGIGSPTNHPDVTYQGRITSIYAVPEPTTLCLVAWGAFALAVRPRRDT